MRFLLPIKRALYGSHPGLVDRQKSARFDHALVFSFDNLGHYRDLFQGTNDRV